MGEKNSGDEEVRPQLQRVVNFLSDSSKITRKKGLLELHKETIDKRLGGTLLQELSGDLVKPVLQCFSDSSEKNRELAIIFVVDYFSVLPSPEVILPFVIPCLVQRLGQETIQEPAEELRQKIMEELFPLIIELCGERIAAYFDEMIQILQRTIVDPFAEVKKASCKVSSLLARTIPQYFHMQSESLINPLMKTISHQHSKVRVAVIEATSDVIQYGNGKSVDDVISHLAQRFFDPSSQVRMCVTCVIGRWLLELPDRYSFFYKFIPLILTSFSDEMPVIQSEARRLWAASGKLFEEENEKDLKDKLDYTSPPSELYPKNETRPGVGCRELVQRNLFKLMPAIIRDLGDWVPATRVKTSALLYQLLLHAEDYTTQHMQPLMQALLKATHDEQQQVFDNALKSAQLIGAFVQPEIFCKLSLQSVVSTAGDHPGALQILAAIISGCSEDELSDHLTNIVRTISDAEVCQTSEKPLYHAALLRCVHTIVQTCPAKCPVYSLNLFRVVVTVLALSKNVDDSNECEVALRELASVQDIKTTNELFERHTKRVIDEMQASFSTWTSHCVEQRVFDTLLLRSGAVVGVLLDEVYPILKSNLDPKKEPELRLTSFRLLSKLLLNSKGTLNSHDMFTPTRVCEMVSTMIAPNLVWHAGRTSAAVRAIAISCMWALLQSNSLPPDTATLLLPDPLLPLFTSLLEDDMKTTRKITTQVLARIFVLCGCSLSTDDVLHKIYMEMLKRLDDADDEIRTTVIKSWNAFFDCFGPDYDVTLYCAHLETMYNGLLVHMDDPDTTVQVAVLDVLKKGGAVAPNILVTLIEKVQHKHRTIHYCEQLKKHVLQIQSSCNEDS